MYSSSYSRAKFGMEARVPLHQSKGKSCGYYMRIIFFFSSLIQSLIIVSLVLFLIYGQPEKSAEEMRVKELEQGYNRLSANNIQLRKEKGQLGAQLGARTAEKGVLEKEVALLKVEANHTEHLQRSKLMMCENAKAALAMMARRSSTPVQHVPVVSTSSELKTLQSLNVQQKAMITLINSNFTQTVHYLMVERDSALKERDETTKEVIALRRQNTLLEEQFTSYTRKCKEDFAHSLDGIHLVTTNFLSRINNLFPPQLTFHLTCDSQREQMEKIRNSCTNLSRDVENKFQLYLDNVGIKVANIQAQSGRLEVLNTRLTSDMQQCESRRREEATQAAQQLELKQRNHDDKVEKLLMEQDRLRNQKKLHEESLMQERKNNQDLQTMLTNARASIPKPAAMPGAPQQGR